MRFRPVSLSIAAQENSAPEPFRSSKSSPASQTKKRGGKFPLKVLSPNRSNVKLTPSSERSAKRQKTTIPAALIEYPSDMAVPSRTTVKALYEAAMQNPESHQAHNLDGTGLLSLEDVFIPAMMQQQVDAVKHLQAKVQRDSRAVVPALQACRRALLEAAFVGIQAAREARALREEEQAKADALRAEERRAVREQAQKEKEEARLHRREKRQQKKEVDMERRKRDAKRKLPRNVELWREVALLMTELSKLQKEERLWKETEQALKNREKTLKVQEKEKVKEWEAERAALQEKGGDKKEHKFQEYVNQAKQDITLSSIRVEQAVQLVSDLVEETDTVHQELARKYREEHQFHGYKGINNPKGLIRAIAMH